MFNRAPVFIDSKGLLLTHMNPRQESQIHSVGGGEEINQGS